MPEKSNNNYLDRVPRIIVKWRLREDGLAELTAENTGFFNRLAQLMFKRPRISYIKHDSLVFKHIDGIRTVYDIGQLLGENYEETGYQLYERLYRYFEILRRNRYIKFM